jgi:ubiquinone/menaquinone biosynthesis C-methylase UbiE
MDSLTAKLLPNFNLLFCYNQVAPAQETPVAHSVLLYAAVTAITTYILRITRGMIMSDGPELSDHKRRVSTVYNLASAGYDKPAVRFFPIVAERLVEYARITQGKKVLDVATGTGAAAISAAGAVGPGGYIVGVDIAADMLAQARRNIDEAGLANVTLHEVDAEYLPYEEGTFDAVICASSIFFFPDMLSALCEWRRVVRENGRVAFSGYGESAFQPISDLFEARIRSYGVSFPSPRRPFSWQRLTQPNVCERLLRDAGFHDIQVYSEQLGYYLNGTDEWWDIVWNSGFRGPVSQLTSADLERFKAEHLSEVARLEDDQGIWLDIDVILALGSR